MLDSIEKKCLDAIVVKECINCGSDKIQEKFIRLTYFGAINNSRIFKCWNCGYIREITPKEAYDNAPISMQLGYAFWKLE